MIKRIFNILTYAFQQHPLFLVLGLSLFGFSFSGLIITGLKFGLLYSDPTLRPAFL